MVALRAFLKFCLKHDLDVISPDKLELGKVAPREVNFLEDEEIQRLLAKPAMYEKKPLKLARDEAILYTLFGTGLRVSELVSIQRKNIKFDSNQFWVIGK